MSELTVNKLFELSKKAKSNKNYPLEKEYLMQAISLEPLNLKLINALIRNLRKEQNTLELKKWLEILYEIKPNGKILFELTQIEQKAGNLDRVKELLLENERIAPNSKKIKHRIKKINAITDSNKNNNNDALFNINDEELVIIKSARNIIYTDEELSSKYDKIISIVKELSEEIILCILAELYNHESLPLAISIVKRYKDNVNIKESSKNLKLANKLLELVMSKKTKRYTWNNFWISNTNFIQSEPQKSKVLKKDNFEKWLS